MPKINNKEDWWNVVKENKQKFLDLLGRCNYNVYESLGAKCATDSSPDGESIKDAFERCIKEENHKEVHSMCHRIWGALPDKPHIHQWPGFYDICDVCSEYWVFQEEVVDED